MKKTSDAPVKVSDRTKKRVRFAAVLSGRSQGDMLDAAVDEYITRHSEDFAVGLSALVLPSLIAILLRLPTYLTRMRKQCGESPGPHRRKD